MAEVKYTPVQSEITLLLPKIEEKTKSGIIKSQEMMNKEREKFTGAVKVVHCGPNIPRDAEGKPQVLPGDKVLLRNGAMLAELNIGGMQLQQTDFYQVLGVIGR